MRIYLAAPLFTPFDRARNVVIASALESWGHTVFLPQLIRTPDGLRPSAEFIFRKCVEGVDDCDVTVGLVDGPDVDSGTAWELGYAFARSKPIVALRTDYRGAEDGAVNLMIARSATLLVESRDPLGPDTSHAISRLVDALSRVARSERS
jgi:nucleoside 2-deoxyribosyltransferase